MEILGLNRLNNAGARINLLINLIDALMMVRTVSAVVMLFMVKNLVLITSHSDSSM